MAIKVDLEKAYDRLKWHFIRDMLNMYNFPPNMISLIMSYISGSSISVLFNGGCLEPFLPTRGIRQGDPLSPYLFILCMELLGFLIEDMCANNLWNPLKASNFGPAFSHLFFADDLVLFAKADRKNCQSVRDVLETFCNLLGQKVNLSKSKVLFSANVDLDSRETFSNLLGISATHNLGKYLGFPIKFGNSSTHDFDYILDKVQAKLQGWKANLLSMAGRLTLTKAVISAIPSYAMQGCYLPERIHNNLDRISRNFL